MKKVIFMGVLDYSFLGSATASPETATKDIITKQKSTIMTDMTTT